MRFIERNRDKPFFLYKSHYSVHTRLAGKPDLVKHFEAKPGTGKKKNNPHLAAMLKVIDEGVGMIMDKLEELGLADRTMVIFTSDNGGESRVTSNAPLRDGKSHLYEGGIREPLIVRWPDMVRPGTICGHPTVNIDFYPTFQDVLGSPAAAHKLDGVSIIPPAEGRRCQARHDVLALSIGEAPLSRRPLLRGHPQEKLETHRVLRQPAT